MEPTSEQLLAQLLARVDALAARVAELEQRIPGAPAPKPTAEAPVGAPPPPRPAPPPVAPPMAASAAAQPGSTGIPAPPLRDPEWQPARVAAAPAPPSMPPPVARGEDLESTMGLTWVNRIGALTLILAIGFVFKYAADNNWITPGMRVMLGVLAGIGAVGGAEALLRKGHRVVAQGIAGVGVATVYFSLYAAYEWYGLLPQLLAFGAMAATALGAGALALRYQSQGFAVLAALGGFVTPLLLSEGEPQVWTLNAYVLLLAGSGMFVALQRDWKPLMWVLYLGAKFLYWASILDDGGDTPGYPGLVFGVALYALFLQSRQWPLVALAQVSFGFSVLTVTGFEGKPVWSWEIVLPALIGLGIAIYRRAGETAFSAMLLAHGLLLVCTGMMAGGTRYLSVPDGTLGAVLLAGVWAAFTWYIVWFWLADREDRQGSASALFAIHSLLFAAELHLFFEGMEWPLSAAAIALLAVLHGALSLAGDTTPFGRFPTLRATAQLLCFALLAFAVPLEFEGQAVTILWAGLAASISWVASTGQARWAQPIALTLFAITLLKYLFEDLPEVAPADAAILATGLFTGIVVAASHFAAAYYWRNRMVSWLLYFAGHAALLVAFLHEVWLLPERVNISGSDLVFRTAGFSVVLAVYGAGLVLIGVLSRSRANRIAGLGMLAFVAAKLYLFDVWLLGTLARIVAFGALGTMLLATSFLYSRLKQTVRDLLADDQAHAEPQPLEGAPPLPPPPPPTAP